MHFLMPPILLLIIFPLTSAISGPGAIKSVTVSGQILCNGRPAENILIKLHDINDVRDGVLDEDYTDDDGEFEVNGKKSKSIDLDVIDCMKRVDVEIPTIYDDDDHVTERSHHIGVIDLAVFTPQVIDCDDTIKTMSPDHNDSVYINRLNPRRI
ncbi:Transthyretin-like family protein [Dictyocaulus viviparus]|uniref:Transthyretin-like family protein n=1 Tax=Dictyocaulus viviparus TaxID=29172 RepID=A0A0D8XVN6_DICVI|nr:Transthyretin-like family protein [Dictyocaulus viviparus]